jgi:hypothetical protein
MADPLSTLFGLLPPQFDTALATGSMPIPGDWSEIESLFTAAGDAGIYMPEGYGGELWNIFQDHERNPNEETRAALATAFGALRGGLFDEGNKAFARQEGEQYFQKVSSLYDDDSAFGELRSRIEGRLEDPLYSEQNILESISSQQDQLTSMHGDATTQIEDAAAARGLGRSGITLDLVDQANRLAGREMVDIAAGTRERLTGANETATQFNLGALGALDTTASAAITEAEGARTETNLSNIPGFDPNRGTNAVTAMNTQLAAADLFNQQQWSNWGREQKDDMQGYFDNLMGVWNMGVNTKSMMNSKPGSEGGFMGF